MKLHEAYDRLVPEVFQHVKDVVEPEVLDPALAVIRGYRQPQVLGSALENIRHYWWCIIELPMLLVHV